MDIREEIIVNGNIPVKLQPYTELRHEQLQKVEGEIDEFLADKKDLTFKEMKREKKAYFWMKKAEILWEPHPALDQNGDPKELINSHWNKEKKFFTKEFFMDKAFEYTLIRKSQDFFLMQEVFL